MLKKKITAIATLQKDGTLKNEFGEPMRIPHGWKFLAAGDAGITRKVKAKQQYIKVEYKKGRRTYSKGIWAPAEIIIAATNIVTETRSTDAYKRKMESSAKLRQKKEQTYQNDFTKAIVAFLNFHERYTNEAETLSQAICEHATPVGSGTVARTAMIPIEERARKAVIAWMRHKTTGYDHMKIARIKGERRNVRRSLAQTSTQILQTYRLGKQLPEHCPLKKAIEAIQS